MSEYQRVAFRAIDRPVSDENLEFMQQQSSRAKITPRTFDNDYQFGDFHGNAVEMLRRGYDLHVHYANFGTRKVLIRLPHGLPDAEAAKPYLGKESVEFIKDKSGPGGILAVDPNYEAGEVDEIWEDDFVDAIVPLRAEILAGDLRPLYLAHLAMAYDSNHNPDKTNEAPVPAGFDKLSDAQKAFAEFYGLSADLIAAAAEGCPPRPTTADPREQYTAWLQSLPQATKDEWLVQCMADLDSGVGRDLLAAFRRSHSAALWPTVRRDRTITELRARAEEVRQKAAQKAATKAAAQRAKRR